MVESDAVWQLNFRTVSETNKREHWAIKYKRHKQQREAIHAAYLSYNSLITLPAVVTMIRRSPRELDDDNLCAAFKAVRDQIAQELTGKGKGMGDRDPRITWRYAQEKCHRDLAGTTIHIQSSKKQ